MKSTRERKITETWLQREKLRDDIVVLSATEKWLQEQKQQALNLAEELASERQTLVQTRGTILLRQILSNGLATSDAAHLGSAPGGQDIDKLSEDGQTRTLALSPRARQGSTSPFALTLKSLSSDAANRSIDNNSSDSEEEAVSPSALTLEHKPKQNKTTARIDATLGWSVLKKAYNSFIAHNATQAVLVAATIVALFLDDVRLLHFPKSWDGGCSITMAIVMAIFALEWLLNCKYIDGYTWGMFYWLDGLATLSIIADVPALNDMIFGVNETYEIIRWTQAVCGNGPLIGGADSSWMAAEGGVDVMAAAQIARSGRAAKIGSRAARLVRIIRVLRVMRILKVFSFCKKVLLMITGKEGEEEQLTDQEVDVRDNPSQLGMKMAQMTSQRVIIVVLSVFITTSLVMSLFAPQDRAAEVGVDWMEESSPVSNETYKKFIDILHSQDADILCLHAQGETLYYEDASSLRLSELQVAWSSTGSVMLLLSTRQVVELSSTVNISTVVSIIMVLLAASFVFMQDSQKLVIEPIARIVTAVNKMNATVMLLGGQDCTGDTGNMEITLLESIITKMATLLKIGFGEAGHAIISKNLSGSGTLNAMLPGRHITAVFGFCYIGEFTDTTEILRGNVMPFVNFIAEILHGEVCKHNGYPNKNIGDAFLCAWKTENCATGRGGGGRRNRASMSRRLSLSPEQFKALADAAASREGGGGSPRKSGAASPRDSVVSPTVQTPQSPGAGDYETQANNALQAFINVIELVSSQAVTEALYQKHPKLFIKRVNYKLNLGFGLHHGWAIEGAIGSEFKVDASYLSPHVNMAARLEAATKQYDVVMLLSGAFVTLLSQEYSERCRQIDRVKVVGSDKVTDLFVCDVPTITNEAFLEEFHTGFEYYSDGEWPQACARLLLCKAMIPDDGPTLKLISIIEDNGGQAPEGWIGWRKLTSK